uniref:ATP synthase F0 subunit 8 n=1 Tax=Anemonia manjano TaxID=105399 RepID=A0A2L0WQZ3_ANEMA|nr:ATP synthase F0 subunit 8 [Anemonia manjano]AVA29799.1 ATP synthase F0 subunit 8 [Anemonia manjano]
MPQLEIATYLTQYRWTLIALFLLFSFLVISVLPVIKTNFLIRRSVGVGWTGAPKTSDLNKGPASLWSQDKI